MDKKGIFIPYCTIESKYRNNCAYESYGLCMAFADPYVIDPNAEWEACRNYEKECRNNGRNE